MRYGVNILNFGTGTEPATLLRWARYAEERGFHFAMISDHVAVTEEVAQQYEAPFYDPFTTLAWLAGHTERIELGTTVTVLPFRHPLLTARAAANIDRFSGGRLIVGVGVSWSETEYRSLGVEFGRRGAITDEYLDVVTRAWRHEKISHHGEFVTFDDVSTGPLPVRVPPVWVGGAGKAALRRTVRYGDAWHPLNLRMRFIREEGLPTLRRIAEDEGRPVPQFAPRLPLRLTGSALEEETRLAGQGTLEQIRRDLDGLAELGATHVLFDTYRGEPASMRPQEEDERLLETVAEHVLSLAKP
ncbi:F420-dependent oxidoreductase [Streptomyces abyssalis]|uniref:F420-dependent oxidoreductase n=1 Tax=Streptomyces abyssalis TaxID=933944 RepID=A0A1E7JTE8_9ACTN|nr:TIGR03619 family F420-dependent LLM class oxidoreductase [Streptomyces abyssalis]OEU92146.1 F420-dependent oxidoreductase [Streptomyces abyssalis]OEU94573.1 F420-dependent oxidoreductase [Streptomyces abyssalis]OEV29673.1 F420-dependent oxidoreductase [Streptomyces nanshensis]